MDQRADVAVISVRSCYHLGVTSAVAHREHFQIIGICGSGVTGMRKGSLCPITTPWSTTSVAQRNQA